MIPVAKRPKKLPVVIGGEDVQRLLDATTDDLMRIILATLYGTGLRLNEALGLQRRDVDRTRRLLYVRNGKGQKDRVVRLSPALWLLLQPVVEPRQVKELLFVSPRTGQRFNPWTIQSVCRDAAETANLHQHVTPHVLRHSYATGMLEAGVDLPAIQKLQGHKCRGVGSACR